MVPKSGSGARRVGASPGKIGEERLFPMVNSTDSETVVAVAGVSCRQQIEHFTERSTRHIAEVLAGRIAPGHVWQPPANAEPEPVDVEPTPEVLVHEQSMTEGPA